MDARRATKYGSGDTLSHIYVKLRLKKVKVRYIGRRRRSSTAEGDPTVHKKEQERIVSDSLTRKN
ncbi:hypothetical protein ACEQPO_16360 [Bacillus sp. SL00103]